MAFSLDQLRGFVAVADELHFGRAAARLSMTQPPLSRAVQKLEREVGAQLLERDSRGVRLTPAGEVFLGEARRMLSIADSAPSLARRFASGTRGAVRIGFTAASAYRVLGDLLNRLSKTLPDVEVELFEHVSRETADGLLGGELDLGLARPPFDSTRFSSHLMHREALLVAMPADHRLATTSAPGSGAGAPAVDPAELAEEHLVMPSPTRARYFYDLAVAAVPVQPRNVSHSVSQILSMLLLVQAGRGVALVPESATALGLAGVVFRPLVTRHSHPVELHLLWSKEARNPALPLVVAELCRTH